MTWTPLQKLIPQTAGKYSFATSLKAIEVCQAYKAIAPTLLPADVLENTFPKSYVSGVLTIATYDSLWAQQVQMKKHVLIEAINQKFDQLAQNQKKLGNRLKMDHKLPPIIQSIRIVIAEKSEDTL